MSDAITLDVLSSSPVQLDVGDADPIARKEIAALATRVTTVEGDVTALDGRLDTAEGDISTLGTTVDGIDARVEAIEADYVTAEDVMGALGGEAPALVAGSSRALLGDPETASWMERTTAADGAALIESICGNTVVQDGSLLPVRMEGVETVGFNQWDEQWELGSINANTGASIPSSTTIRCKNYIHVFPGQTYYFNGRAYFWAYGADKGYVDRISHEGIGGTSTVNNNTITIPNNVRYLRFVTTSAYGTTYNHDICINLSDPARNGTYEPYWSSQRAIPASTYFPDGMRSAGTVRDELTETQAITRVGHITFDGSSDEAWVLGNRGAHVNIEVPDVNLASTNSEVFVGVCNRFANLTPDQTWVGALAGVSANRAAHKLTFSDGTGSMTVDAWKTWLAANPVAVNYVLDTPTTTPIDPPLNMTYRTAAGGTERVMVPTGELSAPPTIVTAQGYTAESLRDAALSAIAPVENGLASTNYGIGSYLVHGGQLCRVTTAIATGEAITPGTNVMATTVMAEVLSLIQ